MTTAEIKNIRKYINDLETRKIKSFEQIGEAKSFLNSFLSFCKKENIITDFNSDSINKVLQELEE